jgi:single-strand DNA-binding protein
MNSLNLAQIIGNMTRDPELRQTKTGQAVCSFGVATNRKWKDASGQMKEEAEFHNIVCWGKLAEIVNQYLKKGAKVFFSGRLQTKTWEDDAGVKHYRTEIIAQDMIMLGGRGEGSAPNVAGKGAMAGEEEVSAEDLPF